MSQVQSQIQKYKGVGQGSHTQSLCSQRPLSSREDCIPRHKFSRIVKCHTYNFIFFFQFFLKKNLKMPLAALCSMWHHSSLTRD